MKQMYKFGVEFSLTWVNSFGCDKLPDGIRLELESHVEMMREILKQFEQRQKAALATEHLAETHVGLLTDFQHVENR